MRLKAHTYDITTVDNAIDRNGDMHTEIQLWCFDSESRPALLRVRDFPVICKLELPITTDRDGNMICWDNGSASDLIGEMRMYMAKKEMEPFDRSSFTFLNRLYYHEGGKKYPYLVLTFKTVKNMYSASRLFKTFYSREFGKLTLVFRETKIEMYNKMFSLKNLGPTERFECEATEIAVDDDERITKPGTSRGFKEYEIEWSSLRKIPSDMWPTYPKIFSWDIESYSHRPRAFPQKNNMYDRIFSISGTTQIHTKPETRINYVVIIGPSEPQEDVVTYNVETEEEVIDKFFELLMQEDPDVLIGYNIFGFDYDYMDARIKGSGKRWPNVGRLIEQKCDIKSVKWKSGAYGHNNINYVNAAGRISVDMYPYIKRDYKLPMYNLNAVGHYFLNENKTDLKAEDMFKIHKEISDSMSSIMELGGDDNVLSAMDNLKQLNIDDESKAGIEKAIRGNTLIVKYNVQDSVLVLKLFEKLNVWISLIELSAIVRVTPVEFFTRGQQLRCVAQLYHAASHRNIVLTSRQKDYIFFNGGKVEDPRAGFWKLVFCYDFTSLYPSIIIAYNICFTTLIRNKDLEHLEAEKYHRFEIEQEEPVNVTPPTDDNFDYGDYFGPKEDKDAIKGEKVKREYVFGFAKKEVKRGLLPEILNNLLSQRKKSKNVMKEANTMLEKIDQYIYKPHRSNPDIDITELTEVGQTLIQEFCQLTKGKLSEVMDKVNTHYAKYNLTEVIFNSRQLGLKVSSNSMYGFLGAQHFGDYSLIEGSMVITSEGRNLITNASLFFEKHYGAITVYGDTDSTMFSVPSLNDDPAQAQALGQIMEDHINGNDDRNEGIFPEPIFLGLEKYFAGLFMKKKKYAYINYDQLGNTIKEKNSDKDELNVKGIVLARRDNCEWLCSSYENCIRGIFEGKTVFETFDEIIQNIINVIELKFDITKELSIVRAMGSNYKSKTYFLSIFSDLMKTLSRPIAPSERFKYVIVDDHQKRDKIGYKMRTIEMFNQQWDEAGVAYNEAVPESYQPFPGMYPPEKIDSCYYITNVLKEPIDQLFEFGFAKDLDRYTDVVYKPVFKKRLKPVSITRPIAMIELLIKDREHLIKSQGVEYLLPTLKQLPEWFRNCKK